jgi:type II secretory pathway pseudopilin PulG
VELLAGMVILVVAVTGSLTLFISTVRQSREAAIRNQLQAAVDEDLALVQQLNDRYRCGNLASSTDNCAVLNAEPNELQYAPAPPATASFPGSGYERFRTLCRDGTLTASLITAINGLPQPAGITRVAVAEDPVTGTGSNVLQAHRYRVTWTQTGPSTELRQLYLTPSVARWCPS